MRIPLIVGNWKMNKTASEAVSLVRELLGRLPDLRGVDVVLAPPFTALESVRGALGAQPRFELGAQNLHWEDQGAFTGEISGPMLKDLGCRYVIVGHSERRTGFGERDEEVRKKIRAALRHGLKPILCVGESSAERDAGRTESVVIGQLEGALADRSPQEVAQVTVAYEPVWAIGTGTAATPDQAAAVHRTLRRQLTKNWSADVGEAVRVLYGGSVTPQNIEPFLESDEIDGALVGGACLIPESFATIACVARARHV